MKYKRNKQKRTDAEEITREVLKQNRKKKQIEKTNDEKKKDVQKSRHK